MWRFFSLPVITGFLCFGGIVSSALGAASPPAFSPNSSVGWVSVDGGLKPPINGAGPIGDDPAHPTVSNNESRVTGKQPTFPVADVSNPILQPWARESLRKHNEAILAGKPGFSPRDSCWPIGVPGFLLEGGFNPVFIIQTPSKVIMVAQGDNHQLRHIYLDVPHSSQIKPSWFGESVGHYEGDTLVVDTIGLNDRTFIDDYQTPHTEKLHVVERFHLIDGGKMMEANLHVEDAGAFTVPWDAVQYYKRVEPGVAENKPVVENDPTSTIGEEGPLQERLCSESYFNYFGYDGMPQAKSSDF